MGRRGGAHTMMTDHGNEKRLFQELVDLSPSERSAYFDEHSVDFHDRRTVESLLRHHDQTSSLPTPPWTDFASLGAFATERTVPERFDEFEILHMLGAGGMGEVYLARDTSPLDRLVAIKFMATGRRHSDRTVARFEREARAAGQLQHPGIVSVHRVGETEGLQYIVMEYVEGRTLGEILHELRQMPKEEAQRTIRSKAYLDRMATLVAHVADALHYAHESERRIVHRDVKPSNILVDANDVPKVADFGIAKILEDESMTAEGPTPRTYGYMSPEQATEGAVIDARTDVFSLGVVLYEALTLHLPFRMGTPSEMVSRLLQSEPLMVRSVNPAVPKRLQTFVHKALEKQPNHRYSTAAHLAGDLRCYVDGLPSPTRQPGPVRRVRRWARTHRTAAAAVVVGAIALSAGALAAYEIDRRHDLLAGVTLVGDAPGAIVHARRVDETTHEAGEPWTLGVMPLSTQWLDPGQYRFTIVGPGGDYAEVSELVEAGDEVDLTFRILPTDEVTAGMIAVPAGTYAFGYDGAENDLDAAREVELDGFWLDATEVTNAEYREFVDATGHDEPYAWAKYGYDDALADRPVVGISWRDAQMYARWRGKRLPTMFEWEGASRSPDGRLLPWGAEPRPAADAPPRDVLERLMESHEPDKHYELYVDWTRPAGESEPPSALGLQDMFANVHEYVDHIWFDRSNARVYKGGYWVESGMYSDLTQSGAQPAGTPSLRVGFRCAKSMPLEAKQ